VTKSNSIHRISMALAALMRADYPAHSLRGRPISPIEGIAGRGV